MGTPKLTRDLLEGLPKAGDTDPIEYYRRPLIGRLFLERINRGLGMLPARKFDSVLEVGYGAGAVQLALAPHATELAGIDLDADPAQIGEVLAARGVSSKLSKGSVLDLPYPDAAFDLVVSFSVFEHLTDYRRALHEVARVLRPSSYFLLGMPAVNRMMEAGFRAIGFRGIEHHHVTTPAEVAASFRDAGFRVLGTNDLALRPHPLANRTVGPTLYYNWLLTRLRDRP